MTVNSIRKIKIRAEYEDEAFDLVVRQVENRKSSLSQEEKALKSIALNIEAERLVRKAIMKLSTKQTH